MNDPQPTPAPPDALLIVDPQVDFLTADGADSKRHVDLPTFGRTLAMVVDAARQRGAAIVWITSRYDHDDPDEAARRSPTHTGRPCCRPGSPGIEIITSLRGSIQAPDVRVEKRFYDAFFETDLAAQLERQGVKRVALCGVATDLSVRATARTVLDRGYAVEVFEDATTAGTAAKHARSIRALAKMGAQTPSWTRLLAGAPVTLEGLGAGDTTLRCGALPEVGEGAFAALAAEVGWSTMYHRGGEVPRLVAVQGEVGTDGTEPLYRHPVDGQPALTAFTPVVDRIRRAVAAQIGHPLNHCLLQHYRTGRDWIGEHADKTLDMARPSSIVNVSVGEVRTMILKPKGGRTAGAGTRQQIPLPNGSFLVMGLETNRRYLHAIRPANGEVGPRISMTFRHIGTRYDRRTGAVWGTGAPCADRGEAARRAAARAALPPADRARADREEAERMLVLFREENGDPAFAPDAYRPGFEVVDLAAMRDDR